jgi:hypothetical protein
MAKSTNVFSCGSDLMSQLFAARVLLWFAVMSLGVYLVIMGCVLLARKGDVPRMARSRALARLAAGIVVLAMPREWKLTP